MTTTVTGTPNSSTTRNWAVSAVALATFMLLFQVVTGVMSVLRHSPIHQSAMFLVIQWTLQALGIIVSVGFIGGGIQTLRGHPTGPETLEYTAVAAAVIVILSAFYQIAVINSESYKAYLASTMAKATSANPAAAPQMAHMMPIMSAIIMGVIGVMALIQVWYSVAMYRHMTRR